MHKRKGFCGPEKASVGHVVKLARLYRKAALSRYSRDAVAAVGGGEWLPVCALALPVDIASIQPPITRRSNCQKIQERI